MATANLKKGIFSKSGIPYLLLLMVALLLIALYYDYFILMSAPPTGTHIWRQTDSASFAWSYWKNNLNFFHPQIMNRTFGDGFAVSELPLFQYIVAAFYKLFGFHWGISKAIYLMVYFTGLLSIFYIAVYFLNDFFWSVLITLIFFAAPTLVFYGNTCIPDVAALSLSLTGTAFYLSFKQNENRRYLWFSSITFTLAGLMKLTYLLPFAALCGTELAALKTVNRQRFIRTIFLPMSFLIISIIVWWIFLKVYNQLNQQAYFLTNINPYWSPVADTGTKAYILKRTLTEWAPRFFHPTVHILFLLSLCILPFCLKKTSKFLSGMTILLLLGSSAYFILWYLQFLVHDYYTIPFYALYFFSILNLVVLLVKSKLEGFKKLTLKILAIILLIWNIHHTKNDFQKRYDEAALYPLNTILADPQLIKEIRQLGVAPEDYLICIPDISPQTSLCLLSNPGFTEFGIGLYDLGRVNEMKIKGAKYLVLFDKVKYADLVSQLGTPLGKYKEVSVYKL